MSLLVKDDAYNLKMLQRVYLLLQMRTQYQDSMHASGVQIASLQQWLRKQWIAGVTELVDVVNESEMKWMGHLCIELR